MEKAWGFPVRILYILFILSFNGGEQRDRMNRIYRMKTG